MAKKDEETQSQGQQSQGGGGGQNDAARLDAAEKDRSARGPLNPEPDGAAREALSQRKREGRAAGQDFKDENLAITPEEVTEKGWLGYSPTGPGENDAPWMRERGDNPSRLGSLGEFEDE